MATGTLHNIGTLGFVRTPPAWAERIVTHLLRFGAGAHVIDPTVGEGDLLAPCLAYPQIHLYGVELSDERAAVARERLPGATILTGDSEAVQWSPGSMDLVLANPPYFFVDGQRAEYRIVKRIGEALRPGGVMVAILPARSGWDAAMINHWSRCYSQVRCWKFPDAQDGTNTGAFETYTQIVVMGVRRPVQLDQPVAEERQRLLGWRWRKPKGAESPWSQGFPPPELPAEPIPTPYVIPDAQPKAPQWRMTRASDAVLLDALRTSGAHLSPDFAAATTWTEDVAAERPIMPATGEAHLAADILTGLLDGEPIVGPEGTAHVFSSYITSEWINIPVDEEVFEEAQEKGVVHMSIRQQQDKMVLGDLNLVTGTIAYHQGDAVFTFLAPWLPTLASLALARRRPLYELHPDRWEMLAVAGLGWDKRLPNAKHPGLAPAQQHRVYAMGRALDTQRMIAIQGEPGTGKTRQTLAVAKRQSLLWRQPAAIQREVGGKLPAWSKRLRQAWQHAPRAKALLPKHATIPAALPVLVATPKRVTPTWQNELQGAWPEAESMVLRSHSDIDAWMRRCATTTAPMVLGIVSHSLSRAFGRMWEPAVLERRWVHVTREVAGVTHSRWIVVPEESTPQAVLRAQGDPQAVVIQIAGDDAEAPEAPPPDDAWRVTKRIVEYRCPDCGAVQRGKPHSGSTLRRAATPPVEGASPTAKEDDELEAVTSRTWFVTKPRVCSEPGCGATLWTEARTNVKQRGIPFASWAQAVLPLERELRGQHALLRSGSLLRGTAKPTWFVDANGNRRPFPAPSFSPYEYLRWFYPGCVALAIIDESHNARGRSTDIAQSVHNAQIAAQTYIYASGTHYGGCLDDLFHYWMRFCPRFWRALGLGWDDVEKAISQYGVVRQTTKEYESDARKGSGKTDVRVTTLPAPGISAKLIPHLLKQLVFLTVLDVGAFMPPLREFPVVVSMNDVDLRAKLEEARATDADARRDLDMARKTVWDLQNQTTGSATTEELAAVRQDEQEAASRAGDASAALVEAQEYVRQRDLAGHYRILMKELEDLASHMNSAAMLAKGTMPRWFAALPFDPRYEVRSRRRDDWGNVIGEDLIAATPALEANYLYPLERALIRTVASETLEPLDPADPSRKRTCMVYFEQNALRDMGKRLAWVLREFDPWILPNKVEAEDREDAIRLAIRAGHQVVIVPYKRVAEGINLQDCVDTICWMELAQSLFHLDQASRRAWRLGRAHEVRLYYFAYAGSAAHQKLQKLGSQSGAAAAFAGEPARGALVEHVGADKTMLARLSQSLKALESDPLALDEVDVAALQSQFDRRGRELKEALARGRNWMGIDDPLPDLLEPIYAELEAAALTNTHPEPERPVVVSPASQAVPIAETAWQEGDPAPEPLPVAARLRWDDPDLFRRAHPRIAARRAKAHAQQPTDGNAAAPDKVKANAFPTEGLWALLEAVSEALPARPSQDLASTGKPAQLTLFDLGG